MTEPDYLSVPYNVLAVVMVSGKVKKYFRTDPDGQDPEAVTSKDPKQLHWIGCGFFIASDKVMTVGHNLFKILDRSEQKRSKPYHSCEVIWAEECFIMRMDDFLSNQPTTSVSGREHFEELKKLGVQKCIPVNRYQTTYVDLRSKFAAWMDGGPFPPCPDLAVLHIDTQAVQHLVPIQRERIWPLNKSAPDMAYALGASGFPFTDKRNRLVRLLMVPMELFSGAAAIPNIPAVQCRDLPDLLPNDPGLMGYPSYPSLTMCGPAYPWMYGSPVFCPSNNAASKSAWDPGMFLIVSLHVWTSHTYFYRLVL